MGGIWTLCGLWKGIRRWIPIILVWRVFKKWRELLYEETKSIIKRCVKVVELIVFYFLLFLLMFYFPTRMIVVYCSLM